MWRLRETESSEKKHIFVISLFLLSLYCFPEENLNQGYSQKEGLDKICSSCSRKPLPYGNTNPAAHQLKLSWTLKHLVQGHDSVKHILTQLLNWPRFQRQFKPVQVRPRSSRVPGPGG